jgi:beta-galactosidase
MLTEGYRWAEYGAYQFWLGSETAIDQYSANPNLAVFCREWDSTFAPGQKVVRHLAIFNDQFHDDGPITFQSTLTVGSKTVFATSQTFTVLPGNDTHFEAMLPIPAVSTPRTSGEWILTLAQGGKTRFRDVKPISVLAPSPPLAVQGGASKTVANRPQRNIVPLVYDPQGQLLAYLIAHQARVRPLRSLEGLPTDAALLIVGKDALTAEESASSRLAAWAAPGRRVLVLEQRNPLKYQGLPGIMEPSENEGRIAFIEDESHPVFQNLKNSDFFAWVNGEIVYRNAYEKPTQGAKSLLQCDNRLSKTAIAEVPAGKGLILVCQVRVAETLNTSSVARQLLNNLLEYAIFYKQEFRPVIAVTDGNADTIKAMLAVGVRFTQTMDPLKALSPGTIAVVAATPANLKTLAANLPKAETFTRSGGWLFLTDLTPEGLADYNKIVGFHHMIRPFRRERVTFPAKRDPLTAGLSNGDIVLSSGERINGFSDDVYLSADVFRFVLDYDDVAPFAKLPDPAYWGNTDASNDHNPYNIVNGFTTSDSWQLIFSMWAGAGGKPQVPMQLPQVQTLTDVEWIGNALYYPTKQFEISTETEAKAVFNPTPNNEPQTFAIKPPLTGKDFLVKITGWVPAHEPSVVGIDNIRLKAKRSPEFYRTVHPLLNIGALMRYDRGKGGIVLCNVLFQEAEAVPENKRKKQNILATLLRNLKAPIGGTAAVIAGSSLTYTPVEIGKFATQFRNEQGWFGDKQFTFKDLPTGKQTFAGVPFTIYQFATSPVPNAVMLKGEGIPGNLPEAVRGIPVGQKADALFFLQTARIDNRRNAQEIREKKHDEMARYIVTYTDGQRVTIPVYAEIDVDDYRQESPRTLPGAQIGWEKKFPGTSYSAVAYVMQWNNPRPAVAIRSVDLEYGADRRGVPVLLALTAATATTH